MGESPGCRTNWLDQARRLSKASDLVNHLILLKKMERYSVRGGGMKWFQNYLAGYINRLLCRREHEGEHCALETAEQWEARLSKQRGRDTARALRSVDQMQAVLQQRRE